MYQILYIGRPIKSFIRPLLKSSRLTLLGYVLDDNIPDSEIAEDITVFKSMGLKKYTLSDIERLKPDLLLVPYYTRLLAADLLDRYLFVNIHGGILPKWRGMSSNLWALLNGANKVGYTVHRIRSEMDRSVRRTSE